jgi:cation diffusion facilitator CzcD-associated flavoprotein CzcO
MPSSAHFDAIMIGAGFSGLYALHRLRQLGIRTRVLEMAKNVGGTWLYNRYPGARCDIESIEYSYSFSEDIQQEWVWTGTMPAQPEIEAYLNFVADRLDLRRDISFNAEVVAMTFDEDAAEWSVETWSGESFVAPFVVAASGILSVPLEPQILGMDAFAGPSLYTSCWPKGDVELTDKTCRRHRHRFDWGAIDSGGGASRCAPDGVPALARVHAAVGNAAVGAG